MHYVRCRVEESSLGRFRPKSHARTTIIGYHDMYVETWTVPSSIIDMRIVIMRICWETRNRPFSELRRCERMKTDRYQLTLKNNDARTVERQQLNMLDGSFFSNWHFSCARSIWMDEPIFQIIFLPRSIESFILGLQKIAEGQPPKNLPISLPFSAQNGKYCLCNSL